LIGEVIEMSENVGQDIREDQFDTCPRCNADVEFCTCNMPDDWDDIINDDWSEEEIADMLDAGICPECGAELDICGHAEMFEYPSDGHTCYWLEIEVDDDEAE
jgi:hypothetical protein